MPNNDFDKFMKNQIFDDMGLKLDTDYVDIDLGYNKEKGTHIGATIDLTTKPKSDNDVRMAAIELEREKLKLQREMFMKQNSVQPTISQPVAVQNKEEETVEEIPEFGGKAFLDE